MRNTTLALIRFERPGCCYGPASAAQCARLTELAGTSLASGCGSLPRPRGESLACDFVPRHGRSEIGCGCSTVVGRTHFAASARHEAALCPEIVMSTCHVPRKEWHYKCKHAQPDAHAAVRAQLETQLSPICCMQDVRHRALLCLCKQTWWHPSCCTNRKEGAQALRRHLMILCSVTNSAQVCNPSHGTARQRAQLASATSIHAKAHAHCAARRQLQHMPTPSRLICLRPAPSRHASCNCIFAFCQINHCIMISTDDVSVSSLSVMCTSEPAHAGRSCASTWPRGLPLPA